MDPHTTSELNARMDRLGYNCPPSLVIQVIATLSLISPSNYLPMVPMVHLQTTNSPEIGKDHLSFDVTKPALQHTEPSQVHLHHQLLQMVQHLPLHQ